MSKPSTDGSLFVICLVAFFVIMSAGARSVGLDVTTLFTVGTLLLVVVLIAGLALYMQIPARWVIPGALVAGWLALWPALDYYATSEVSRHLSFMHSQTPWFATWYAKLGVAFALALTYLIPYQLSRRY